MPNINTSGPPITNVNNLKLFGMGENEEVGWISSDSLAPVAHELGDDPDLAVSQKLLTDSIAELAAGEAVIGGKRSADVVGSIGSTGYLPFSGHSFDELGADDVRPINNRLYDDLLYGSSPGSLHVSQDVGNSWSPISDLLSGMLAHSIHPTGDGEVLVASGSIVMKSSGWGSGSVTFSTVLTNPTSSVFQPWQFDTLPEQGLAVVSHYSAGGLEDFKQSRYVWLSYDNGNTWEIIRDLEDEAVNDQHIHFVVFDRFSPTGNRIWFCSHNYTSEGGSGKLLQYSDDLGQTWNDVNKEIEWQGATMVIQPTVAVPTPHGVVMGSDDSFSGLFIWRRDTGAVEILAEGGQEDFVRTVRMFFFSGLYDPKTQTAYLVGYQSAALGGRAMIMASDGITGSLVYMEPESYPNGLSGVTGAPGFYAVSVTGDTVVAMSRKPSATDPETQVRYVFRAKKAKRGVPPLLDTGRIFGGNVGSGNVRNTAVGFNAIARGPLSLAAGYNAQAGLETSNSALAIGPNSTAANNATAIGCNAAASATGTAIGLRAESTAAFGMAIGTDAKASNGIAIGPSTFGGQAAVAIGSGHTYTGTNHVIIGALATVGNGSVTIGKSALTTEASVAVGRSATAGNYGVAVGTESEAMGLDTIALGAGARVAPEHNSSVAIGRQTETQRANSVCVGERHIESTRISGQLILRSPNGTAYAISVSDAGELVVVAI